MNKGKAEFLRQFQKDMLNDLTANDGENFRAVCRHIEKHGTKRDKRDLERLCQHPAVRPLRTH